MIHEEIWQIYTRHRLINPLESLPSKMLYYQEHFMHFSKLGFIIQPKDLNMFLPNALRVGIGQLRVSYHQFEIENGHGVPRGERYVDYIT